jgi:O-methyltransferase involved in polyketide biosynthesis
MIDSAAKEVVFMHRTENDTWDLASSVGATATGVAAARALDSLGESPLIDDPFAESMVRAVGVDYFTKMAHGQIEPNEDARR